MTTLTPPVTATATTTSSLPGDSSTTRTYEFHQLALAGSRHRWWRPIAVLVLTVLLWMAGALLLLLTLVPIAMANPSFEAALDAALDTTVSVSEPTGLAVTLGTVASLLPALWWAERLVGSRRTGLVSSVAGRLRWVLLGKGLLLAFAVYGTVLGVVTGVDVLTDGAAVSRPAVPTILALLGVTVLLVPLQAAAEEYVFRGALLQSVGSWIPHPAVAIAVPAPLFVVGHGYGPLASTEIALFALMTGWLAWRTGGLELAIAGHVANNVLVLGLCAVGVGDPGATETSPAGLAVALVVMTAFTVLAVRMFDRSGLSRSRATGLR